MSEEKNTFLDKHKANFDTLQRAFDDGAIALMECKDVKTGELVAVVCAVQKNGDDVEMVPFARMFDGNPYEQVLPPLPEGGFAPVPEGKDRG